MFVALVAFAHDGVRQFEPGAHFGPLVWRISETVLLAALRATKDLVIRERVDWGFVVNDSGERGHCAGVRIARAGGGFVLCRSTIIEIGGFQVAQFG